MIIHDDGELGFRRHTTATPTQGLVAWLTDQHQQLMSYGGNVVNTFTDKAKEAYDNFMLVTNLQNQMIQANADVGVGHLDAGAIWYAEDPKMLASAGPVMQIWMMANPTLGEFVDSGTAQGYEGFVNDYKEVYGWQNPYYAKIMAGLIDEDLPGYGGKDYLVYMDSEALDIADLPKQHRSAIAMNWINAERYLNSGIDITSPYYTVMF